LRRRLAAGSSVTGVAGLMASDQQPIPQRSGESCQAIRRQLIIGQYAPRVLGLRCPART
jgi:hypothetical protein